MYIYIYTCIHMSTSENKKAMCAAITQASRVDASLRSRPYHACGMLTRAGSNPPSVRRGCARPARRGNFVFGWGYCGGKACLC